MVGRGDWTGVEGIGEGVTDEGFKNGKTIRRRSYCGRGSSTDVSQITPFWDKGFDIHPHSEKLVVTLAKLPSTHRSSSRETTGW